MNAKKLAIDAMLAAMCAALMFGPIHGMAIGAVGTFIYQILRYGFSYTTVLWMLPYVLCGLAAGLYAHFRHYELPRRGTLITVLPLMILYFVLQRHCVESIDRTGLTGE